MTGESKTEIVLVAIAGAALLWLWSRNRAAGAGSGLEALPFLSHHGQPLPDAAPLFDIPAPVPGETFTYQGGNINLPAPNAFMFDAGAPSACNCAGGGSAASTFGGRSDLVAWLNGQTELLQTAAAGVNNWN